MKRDSFSSKWGFVLAAVGSAVGMANVWAFPYRTAMYGGAAYLIPYILFVLLLSVTGVVEEISFGRWARTGPLGAMQKAIKKPVIRNIGILPVISAFAMATGYAVITGWVIRYLAGSLTGSITSSINSGDYFNSICGNFGSVKWHLTALIIAIIAMSGGIARSIEKINRIIMPLFFLLFLGMGIYIFTIPGSIQGYSYLFIPDWTMLTNPRTWIYALGQAFFSLSLAGNGSVIYGSYLSNDEDVISCSRNIAMFDTIAALLAACVVIPAVFAFNEDPASGPALMFITLPTIFKAMGPLGRVFSIAFFTAIFFAAISSLANLFEAPIEMLQNKLGLKRPLAVTLTIGTGFVIGIFLESGEVISSWMDIMSIYLCPVGALLAAICFYWILGRKTAEEQMSLGSSDKNIPRWMFPTGKYLYCGIALIVIVLGIALGGIG